jgi:hypothetical protein
MSCGRHKPAMGPGMSAPPNLKSVSRSALSNALGARQVVYDLEPLAVEEVDDLAQDVDALANAVHVLATSLITLCEAVEKTLGNGDPS